MAQYDSDSIRTVALVGHGASGKTTLVEALLHQAGVIPSRGSVERGSTVSDFDPLELDRYSTIQQLSRSLAESATDVNSLKDLLQNMARDTEALLVQQARTATELWLREHGAQVVAAPDAESAIEQCLAQGMSGETGPQFLLADYKLLGSTGVEALRELRDRFGMVAAAIVSGEDLKPEQLPPGVPLLAKPLRPEKLLALLS